MCARRLAYLPAVAIAVALALAACGSAVDERATAPSATVDTSALMGVPGRLLVLGTDGSVFTIAPDGSDRVVLAPPGQGRAAAQPTWSPDGTRVAWVDIELRGGVPVGRVAASRADGTDRALFETAAPAFFLAWDPTSSHVAYLHAEPRAGIVLGVANVTGDVAPQVIAGGQPLYFDWAPGGRRLFAHIGEGYLGHVLISGDARPLAEVAAAFRAPEWRRADGRLLYAVRLAGRDAIVARDGANEVHELARFDGSVAFATSPDGRRLAAHVTAPRAERAGESARASISLRQPVPDEPATLPPGLAVVDLATGDTTLVSMDPLVAFFWSPDGERLLYLTAEETLRGVLTRWWTWDDAGAIRLESFAPSLEYARDYLPFFDQYARAATPWSPDGSQFVYAGLSEDGESGVWVQSADGAIPPILVADGVYAAWSP